MNLPWTARYGAEPLFSERAEIVKGDKEAPPPKEGEEAEEKGSEEKQVPSGESLPLLCCQTQPAHDASCGYVRPQHVLSFLFQEEGGNGEVVPAGVPEFWLNVLRNYEQIGEQVGASAATAARPAGVADQLVASDDSCARCLLSACCHISPFPCSMCADFRKG